MDPTGTIFETQYKVDIKGKKIVERLINSDGKGLEFNNFISAARIDENSIFWVVAIDNDRPQYFGFTPDYQSAEKAVLEQLKDRRALCINSNFALQEFLEQEIEKHSGKIEYKETARIEFIYEKYGLRKYQIKKITPKEVYVYSDPYKDGFKTDEDGQSFMLRKRDLDDNGEAKARGQIYCTEAKKHEFEKYRRIPQYLEVFGLDWDANIEDVKYWFRKLSMKYHPDRGGDVEQFRRLTESYGKAVKSLRERDIRDGL